MDSIDKEKFGPYLASLRKRRGLSQRALAQALHVTDKAVSKWERSVSLPDVSLLLPLAQTLGVTVTDLLKCDEPETRPPEPEPRPDRKIPLLVYCIVLTAGLAECCLAASLCGSGEPLGRILLIEAMMALFAAYFLFFAQRRLPDYYDQNRIRYFSDGFFRMNIPGSTFNNRNWPHIRRTGAVSCMAILIAWPILYLLTERFIPPELTALQTSAQILPTLAGLFLPLYWVGKKYE